MVKAVWGEVYLAGDTKLKREVAIKVLPASLRDDPERLRLFRREAEAAARLKHPNIATIHALEEGIEQGAVTFIAMEYVEGKTLADALPSGGMSLEAFFDTFVPLADALAHAHELGRTHRDLKPANIMLAADGTPKILDFGLARVEQEEDAEPTADSEAPTRAPRSLVDSGQLVGTPAYMSPEQAERKAVDARTDLFSLGVVMYEALTGRRPFRGESLESLIGRILEAEPEPVTVVNPATPYLLWNVIRQCLVKDREDRIQTARQLRSELRAVRNEIDGGTVLVDARALPKPPSVWRLAVPVLVAATAFLALWLLGNKTPDAATEAPVRLSLNLPAEAPLSFLDTALGGIGRPALALSPDGRFLVYVAEQKLYLRPMDRNEATPIPGTEGAYGPFFSPDGEWVGFFAGNQLKKVGLSGSLPVVLSEAPVAYGASWSSDGEIVSSIRDGRALVRIPDLGGPPKPFSISDVPLWPWVVPGGRAFLANNGVDIVAVSLDTGESTVLLKGGDAPRYLPTGQLVYEQRGQLFAAPFDPKRLELTGAPVPVLDGIRSEEFGGAQYTFSDAGTLVYAPGGAVGEGSLVWVDRNGDEEALPFPPEVFASFSLSPQSDRLAISVLNTTWDIWIYDLTRGTRSRVTRNATSPVWSPDGNEVVYKGVPDGLFRIAVDSSEEPDVITGDQWFQPSSYTPDGSLLLLASIEPTTGWDIWILSAEESRPKPFIQTAANESFPVFAPGGGWLAYHSDLDGDYHVYVEPYPRTGERFRASADPGEDPVWSPDGTELFYRDLYGQMMAVPIQTAPKFSAGTPRQLFDGGYLNIRGPSFNIGPDGQRFLMVKRGDAETSTTELRVVLNWFDEVERAVAAGNPEP